MFIAFPKVMMTPQRKKAFHTAASKCYPGIQQVGGKSRRDPQEVGYLFSPAVFLVAANNPHGSFCLARKTC